MTTRALHPDQLQPGDSVGAWHIVERLGVGGNARVFKVERDGLFRAMKMALRPLSDSEPDAVLAALRMGWEAAALFTYAPHPNLVRVYAVDCWPDTQNGYVFIVTDLVEGDDWNAWRWRTNPNAAGLVKTYSELVRTVGVLHERGVYHRDLKAENVLIRREDGRAFLIDFGTVRLPGTFALTMGVPAGTFHLLPPELIAYTRSEAWKQQVPFNGGMAADLYALGILLYQGLCDHHPFDPNLPDEQLVTAIATVRPRAPHLINPRAPRSLSDIAMKLLEKRPEDRYPDTRALLQDLELAEKERESLDWKPPLLPPEETNPPAALPEGREERRVQPEQAVSPEGEVLPPAEGKPPQQETPGENQPPAVPRGRRMEWLAAAKVGLALVVLGSLAGLSLLVYPPAQKGSLPVPHSSSQDSIDSLTQRPARVLLWLCAVFGLGCPAAQVRPPPPMPKACPDESRKAMERLRLASGSLSVVVDVNAQVTQEDYSLYREGPLVGRVWYPEGDLVQGTLLYGYLWTGPGLYDEYFEEEAVIGRYTKAVLPDGTEYPVCIALGGPQGRMPRIPGPTPDTVKIIRIAPANAVWRWQ